MIQRGEGRRPDVKPSEGINVRATGGQKIALWSSLSKEKCAFTQNGRNMITEDIFTDINFIPL